MSEQYDEVVELGDEDAKPYQSKCRFKDCTQTVIVPVAAYRRQLYCPTHQLVFRVTKKLAHVGYGVSQPAQRLGVQPRTPRSVKSVSPGRPSKKGIWAAAETVLANARREAFRRQSPPPEPVPDAERTESGIILPPRRLYRLTRGRAA
jgi:hypothetical protein